MISHITGPKFEVKLKKNSSGLGFSFVQMARGNCIHMKNDLVRIKRLFPGQPAEEHGAIAAGDIILAVNGKPIEGLDFQVLRAWGRGSTTLMLADISPASLKASSTENTLEFTAGSGLGAHRKQSTGCVHIYFLPDLE